MPREYKGVKLNKKTCHIKKERAQDAAKKLKNNNWSYARVYKEDTKWCVFARKSKVSTSSKPKSKPSTPKSTRTKSTRTKSTRSKSTNRELTLSNVKQKYNEYNRTHFNNELSCSLRTSPTTSKKGSYKPSNCNIQISDYNKEGWEETLLHEMCHASVHQRKGITRSDETSHGKTWKSEMSRCGLKPSYTSGTRMDVPRSSGQYHFCCSKCGHTITRNRQSNFTLNPSSYYHKKCGGRFHAC